MKKTSGYVVQILDGIHKDKKGYAYHINQAKEITEKGKAIVVFEGETEKVMVTASFCKIIGYCD